MGVLVRLALPEFDIVDLMAGRKRGRPPRQQTSSNQMELENEPDTGPVAPTAQQPDRVQFAQQPADESIARNRWMKIVRSNPDQVRLEMT